MKVLSFIPPTDLMNAIIAFPLVSHADHDQRALLTNEILLEVMLKHMSSCFCPQKASKYEAFLHITERLAVCFLNLSVPVDAFQASRACLAWVQRLDDDAWLKGRILAQVSDPWDIKNLPKESVKSSHLVDTHFWFARLPLTMQFTSLSMRMPDIDVPISKTPEPAQQHPLAALLQVLFFRWLGHSAVAPETLLAAAVFFGASQTLLNTLSEDIMPHRFERLGGAGPLLWACRGLNAAGLHWLMKHQADPTQLQGNKSLLYTVWSEGHRSMIPDLLKHTDPEAMDAARRTLLHHVCAEGDLFNEHPCMKHASQMQPVWSSCYSTTTSR